MTTVTRTGDVFWSLHSPTTYLVGNKLPMTIYVGNPTSTDRRYLLLLNVVKQGVTINQIPINVDGGGWFTVEAGTALQLNGDVDIGATDCTITLVLMESTDEEQIASVSAYLAGATLPLEGGVIGAGTFDSFGNIMILMMVMMMMGKMLEGGDNEKPKLIGSGK